MELLDQGSTRIRLERVLDRFELIVEREEKKIKTYLTRDVLDLIIDKILTFKKDQ